MKHQHPLSPRSYLPGSLRRLRCLFPGMAALFSSLAPSAGAAPGDPIVLHTRSRTASAQHTNVFVVVERMVRWDPRQTAVVICDMWDQHWCRGATARVAEMAPRMNDVVRTARQQGALIIHCPSDTLAFYAGTPQRHLAQDAPPVSLPAPVDGWRGLDRTREAPLPIDDSDGGCDDAPPCRPGSPWKRQIATIEIHDGDAVTDSVEALYLMAQRDIRHVLVMGVHLNMCVLGRPFGIRQLVRQGKEVVLLRDLTDTMYNSGRHPYVPHFAGTDRMIEHVEKFWCPTATSADLIGGEAFRFRDDRRPHLVTLVGEDEYYTWDSLPAFVGTELETRGVRISVLHEDPRNPGDFPGLLEALRDADALLVSVRRRALPPAQMTAIRRHLEQGRALVGIRTTSHAFTLRAGSAPLTENVNEPREQWRDFDPVVLGGNYQGHHGNNEPTTLRLAPAAIDHPILRGIDTAGLLGRGSLYRVRPLKESTTTLLYGSIPNQPEEPVAWTHRYGPGDARVFYTSLGHPEDFAEPRFRRLLVQAVFWALDRPVSER